MQCSGRFVVEVMDVGGGGGNGGNGGGKGGGTHKYNKSFTEVIS